jgi:hypothetical protein
MTSSGQSLKKSTTQVAAKDSIKIKKPKLVRDSFTIPKDEFEVLTLIKQRSQAAGHGVKKSEVLRAGLRLLNSLSDKALLTALKAVPAIKTGRPKNEEVSPSKTATPRKSAQPTRARTAKAKAKPKAALATARP